MSNELKDCPFCGCKMAVRSNRDWHRPEGDHNELCPVYESDLMFPATDQGWAALYAMWNMRALAAPVASAAPSGDLPPLPEPTIEGSVMHEELKICYRAPVHFTADQMQAYAGAAIAHQPPKEALTEKAIDAIWESLPGLTIIKDKPQDQWNRLLRHEFAAAAIAASAPNKQLVAALQRIANWDMPPPVKISDGTTISYAAAYGSNGVRDYMRAIARDALASAGEVQS